MIRNKSVYTRNKQFLLCYNELSAHYLLLINSAFSADHRSHGKVTLFVCWVVSFGSRTRTACPRLPAGAGYYALSVSVCLFRTRIPIFSFKSTNRSVWVRVVSIAPWLSSSCHRLYSLPWWDWFCPCRSMRT